MNCYIINYDLRKTKNYDDLITAIKAYGTFAHILESCWAIVTTQSAMTVRNNLLMHMDNDDGIFVVKSGYEAAWTNTLCGNAWLQKYL